MFVPTNFAASYKPWERELNRWEPLWRRQDPNPQRVENPYDRSRTTKTETVDPSHIEGHGDNIELDYSRSDAKAYMDDDHDTPQRDAVVTSEQLIQRAVIKRIRAICLDYRLSTQLASRAARALLGAKYKSDLSLPSSAEVKWCERSGEDRDLTPIEFLEKYWGGYLGEDALFQSDLRRLDISLFDAVKGYCRNHQLPLEDHLPPPSRTRRSSPPEQSVSGALPGEGSPSLPSASRRPEARDRVRRLTAA
jgi:hypothetical protein